MATAEIGPHRHVGPGMCDHCGAVALALHKATERPVCPCLCHIAHAYDLSKVKDPDKVKAPPKPKPTSKGLRVPSLTPKKKKR